MRPIRKTARLRFGRQSRAGAIYFITVSTKRRVRALLDADTGAIVIRSFHTLRLSGDIDLHAATTMPDHVHFLFTLGSRLRVGQVIAKFKSIAREMGTAPWRWEQDGFEHQMRDGEDLDDYGFYIFMNPYRAGLCHSDESWPWWICPEPRRFRFLDALRNTRRVPSEWFGRYDLVEKRIHARAETI